MDNNERIQNGDFVRVREPLEFDLDQYYLSSPIPSRNKWERITRQESVGLVECPHSFVTGMLRFSGKVYKLQRNEWGSIELLNLDGTINDYTSRWSWHECMIVLHQKALENIIRFPGGDD